MRKCSDRAAWCEEMTTMKRMLARMAVAAVVLLGGGTQAQAEETTPETQRPVLRECPAYTLLCKFSPEDTGQSKVKQSHKIDEVTTVASAQAPKSLQPGKCPFHYPAAGWIPPAFTDFFPPAADMLLKSVNTDFLADSWIIISFVQTEVSNFSPQKPAAHFPRIFQGWSHQAAVMHIGACGRHTQRNTLSVHMEMNLAATSPSVRRIAPRPLSRCFFESASALAARCRP